MRILGIDPGYAIVGYGVVDYNAGRFAPVEYGAITTPAHTLFEERLVLVHDELEKHYIRATDFAAVDAIRARQQAELFDQK